MANNNGKLYITISDERGVGSSAGIDGGTLGAGKQQIESRDTNLITRYAEHELFHIVKQVAQQAVNYQLSNIGNFTGNYIRQEEVNQLKQCASDIMNVGMSTFAGFSTAGPIGAVVGFVAGVTSVVSSAVYSDLSAKVSYAKTNFSISQLRERAGLNATYDGSRGTEN